MADANEAPRLQIVRELGRGTSGVVELAELLAPYGHHAEGALVAVKTLHRESFDDPDARAAFQREAEIGATLRHPSLVEVLHAGQHEGLPRLVMTYIPGRSLAERLAADGSLPEPLVRRLGAELGRALEVLHAAGVTHGDVKPENVRLDDEGQAVLVDLGFAQAQSAPDGSSAQAGSPLYLAPERIHGAQAGAASDVFALGVTLYEAAVGAHPFVPKRDRDDPERALAALTGRRPTPPSHRVPQLTPFFDACMAEALETLPDLRATASELAQRFEQGEAGAWWRARLGAGASSTRPILARDHLTALVGRDAELAEIGALIERMEQEQRGAVCWLSGEEGMGKSRLVEEAAFSARRRDPAPAYLYARCTEIGEARPSGVLLDLVRRWLSLPRGATPTPGERAEIESRLAPDEARALAGALVPERSTAPSETDPDADPDDALTASAIAHWLVALARERPLLVFVDDIEQASAFTRRTLELVAREMAGTRLLLILGERGAQSGGPDASPLERSLHQATAREDGPAWSSIRLRALTESAVERLVDELFHSSTPRLRLARVLWLRSRGVPGLLAEILRGLIERGEARPHDERGVGPRASRLELTIRPEELRLPGSLQRSIAERFGRLAQGERRWLERLAVVGGRIRPDFLERAFHDAERREIDAVLARLETLGWLTAAGERYRFARPALREAVYRAVPAERRRRAHASAARALEPEDGTRTSVEDDFQRAFHLRAAEEHSALLDCLEPLLQSHHLRGQPQRSHTLARWGLEALTALGQARDDPRRLAFLEIAADTADRLGLRADERSLLDRLVEHLPDGEADPSTSARIYLLHARLAFATGQFGLALGMLRNAELFARKSKDAALLSECARRSSTVLAQVGDLARAQDAARRAMRTAASDMQRVLAGLATAVVDLLDDRLDGAVEAVDTALRELRRIPYAAPGLEASALLVRGRIWHSCGRPGRALGSTTRALRLARVAGERRLEAEAAARLGGLYLNLDRDEEAEDLLREALLVADEIEDRRGQILGGVFLGTLLWERDDPSARATTARAVEVAREIGYHRAEAVGLSILARMDREEGELDAALAASERAYDLVRERGAELFDRIVIAGTRALVLRTAERERDARRIVSDLRRRVNRSQRRVERLGLSREWRAYSEELIELVLSPDGNVYPRAREG